VRIGLLFAVVAGALAPGFGARLLAALLAPVVLGLDWADGALARRLGTASRLGAVLDIVGDRLVETIWWITLAKVGLVPLAVPVVVVSRGIVVDALRALALARGLTAFGEGTMMRSRLGHALVASRPSRAAYGLLKAAVFPLLFALQALRASSPSDLAALAALLEPVTSALVGLAVGFCLLRAVPVVVESRALLEPEAGS
jgi:CDP-diacylglycerol--glycerol-3-phosphate 3-phosphatidyltransferase